MIDFDGLEKGDIVYFARIMPKLGYYEVLELKINTKKEDYCTGTDSKTTKQMFLFSKEYAENTLFTDRKHAVEYLKQKKVENKDVKVIVGEKE